MFIRKGSGACAGFVTDGSHKTKKISPRVTVIFDSAHTSEGKEDVTQKHKPACHRSEEGVNIIKFSLQKANPAKMHDKNSNVIADIRAARDEYRRAQGIARLRALIQNTPKHSS